MYHAKKFSTVPLVPHKAQCTEQLPDIGGFPETIGNNSSNSGESGKHRLRWTSDLHDRFVDAITQLGGPDSGYFMFSNGSLKLNINEKRLNSIYEGCVLFNLATNHFTASIKFKNFLCFLLFEPKGGSAF